MWWRTAESLMKMISFSKTSNRLNFFNYVFEMLEKLHAQSKTLYLEVTEGGEGVKRNMRSPQHMVDITVGAAYLLLFASLLHIRETSCLPTSIPLLWRI